jgi:hypothetical protein
MIRGCLEDAWKVLSNHSIVRRIAESDHQVVTDDYLAASNAEWREGFQALKDILKSAPLPGGRTNYYDQVFGSNNDTDTAMSASIVETEYIEGIPSSAYLLWETSETSRGGDYPIHFEPHAAQQLWQSWQQAIRSIPAIQRLRAKIPQLNKLLDMLCGNFRHIEFESWEEELCAELLYKVPNIRLVDMHVKTSQVIKKYSDPPEGFEVVVVNIMKGNAGRVVQVLYDLGGGSGAALPAICVSLHGVNFVVFCLVDDDIPACLPSLFVAAFVAGFLFYFRRHFFVIYS